MKYTIRIATRNSPLALMQANLIKSKLEFLYPELTVLLLGMTTEGDRRLGMPLASVGGKGLFVKELEQALLEGKADLAVHSMKDVPVTLPEDLVLEVICEREDPRDVFVTTQFKKLTDLPAGAHIGTASLRRRAQLKAWRSDLTISSLRGNVQTRLNRLDQQEFDAIILAAAGLKRLQLEARIQEYLALDFMLPAPGQGALGIECRKTDSELLELLKPLHHGSTAICVNAERAVNYYLQGGCQVPIAAYAECKDHTLILTALVGEPNGEVILKDVITGKPEEAEQLGKILADNLLQRGADKILQAVYDQYGG